MIISLTLLLAALATACAAPDSIPPVDDERPEAVAPTDEDVIPPANDEESETAPPIDQEDTPKASINLDNTRWTLVTIDGELTVEGIQITAEFNEGRIGGSAGCNMYGADYKVDGSSLTFSPMISTLMACEEDIMNLESVYLLTLQSNESFLIEDGVLTITGADGTLLSFAAS